MNMTRNPVRSALWGTAGLVGLLLMVAVSGCGTTAAPQKSRYTGADANNQLAKAYNAFGLQLYESLSSAAPQTNVFISPTSVAIALSMVMNGAQGTTRDAIAQTLQVQGVSPDTVNKNAEVLQDLLTHADPNVQLSISNSIWARKDWKFNPVFLQINKDYYKAETASVDFADPKTVDTINKWVDKQTKGKIDSIVKAPLDRDSIMILLNAVYFKGEWSTPFEKQATRELPFTLQDGTKKNYPLMDRKGSFDYGKADGYQAARLPYGDGNTGMIVLLPDEGMKLDALIKRLSGGGEWDRMLAGLKSQSGEVLLPRFKLEAEFGLKDALKSLGMEIAFDSNKADFSSLLTPPPTAYIGDVKHKTFVQVDEKGTEAAAVTKVEMKAGSAAIPPSPFRMEVNRPFMIVIHERQTGSILFVGSVNDPVQ